MQILADLFHCFSNINDNVNNKLPEKMNFLRLITRNVYKTSFVIKKFKPNLLSSTSLLPTWPEWSGWQKAEVGHDKFETESYTLYNLKKKLILSKDILLKERFNFKECGSSVDLVESIHLLLALDVPVNSVHFREFTSTMEGYFDLIAAKEENSHLVYECFDFNKLLTFCDKLTADKLCSGALQSQITSITTFALESFEAQDCRRVVSSYSGNIRLASDRGISIFQQFKSILEASLRWVPSNSYSTDSTSARFTSDLDKPSPDAHQEPASKATQADDSAETRIKAKMEMLKASSGKPPNILIYTASNEDTPLRFTNVVHLLQQCLSRQHYALYHLKQSHVTTIPWIENTVLLVLAADKAPKQAVSECFLAYFMNGGTLLSLACDFDELFLRRCDANENDPASSRVLTFDYDDWKGVSVLGGSGAYSNIPSTDDSQLSLTPLAKDCHSNSPLLVRVHHPVDKGIAVLSRISFDKDISESTVSSGDFISLKQSNPARLAVFKHLLASLSFNCNLSPPPPLTPLLLFSHSDNKVRQFLEIIKGETKGEVYKSKNNAYKFLTSKQLQSSSIETSASFFPVVTDADAFPSEFDLGIYRGNLNTKVLGNVALYSDVITTTMTVMDNFMYHMPPHLGLVVIASSQTAGQGRGGNVWLSPKGCGLFSLHIRFNISSPLGHHLSCVQHLVALAIVLAVRQKPGYEDIDLRIKWPNDVYYGERLKLGGVLVRSTILHDVVHINLGCGLNISNKDPTLCVNDLITQYNNLNLNNNNKIDDDNYNNFTQKTDNIYHNTNNQNKITVDNDHNNHNNANISSKKPLPLLSVEEFVARLISQIEKLIEDFQADDGDSFFELYYKYWLHSNQIVTLNSVDGPRGMIVGLSRYGFLSVRLQDGSLTEVHPDGNSFDMMKNLIAPKIKR